MLRLEPSPRRVRVVFNNEIIADSTEMQLLLGRGTPVYFFPREHVNMELMNPIATIDTDKIGTRCFWSLTVGGKTIENAAYSYLDVPGTSINLGEHIAFIWDAMDVWYEEAEEIIGVQDPYHRVDVRHSDRHIRIELDGITLADTQRPTLLFETGLRTRFYIPREDVNMDYLSPTEKTSICPYKGIATYWSVTVDGTTYRNIVWAYEDPIVESGKIMGMLCFYNEAVDVYIDGELEPKDFDL